MTEEHGLIVDEEAPEEQRLVSDKTIDRIGSTKNISTNGGNGQTLTTDATATIEISVGREIRVENTSIQFNATK